VNCGRKPPLCETFPMPFVQPSPLAAAAPARLRRVTGVLTDIDDTLTTFGAITADALDALHALRAAGIPVIAITGRPAGWSQAFAGRWPVAAIVAENGAVALIPAGSAVHIEFAQDAATRGHNSLRLRAAAERVLREVPGTLLAADSAGRLTDIAIDHSEFASLDAQQVAQVVAVMRAEGLTATVSSIHVNGWFGDHGKPSGARWMVRRLFDRDIDAERERWVYVGDSPNDQAMFEWLPLTVGVANLMAFADRLQHAPAFLTEAERGAGFAEVARALLDARRRAGPDYQPAGSSR